MRRGSVRQQETDGMRDSFFFLGRGRSREGRRLVSF